MNKQIYHKNDIKNCNIQAFSFDHKLTEQELITLEENFLICPNINQIYFKDTIDISSIEQVKSTIENSNLIDDSKIEKYILIDYCKEELNQLLNINYVNPDTWKITYIRTDQNKDIYSITECRKIIEHFNTFFKEKNMGDLSQLEKICLIYDSVKLLDYKEENNHLLEIIEQKYTNSYGYHLLFQELLYQVHIKSYIEKVKTKEENRFISVIDIDDDKYDIHGVYLFDPYSDSLPKAKYTKNNIRRVNYNYFCMNFNMLNNTNYDETLSGICKYFLAPKTSIFLDHIDEIRLLDSKDINKFNNIFTDDYSSLYQKINNTKNIGEDILFEVIEYTLKLDHYLNFDNMITMNLIKENYNVKKEEMYH